MWLNSKVFDLFRISKDSLDSQREEIASLKSERDLLKSQLLTTEANFKWLTTRVNSLEVERAQLIKKAYNIDIPVPEIVRTPILSSPDLSGSLFEDVGDSLAKQLGLPTYNS